MLFWFSTWCAGMFGVFPLPVVVPVSLLSPALTMTTSLGVSMTTTFLRPIVSVIFSRPTNERADWITTDWCWLYVYGLPTRVMMMPHFKLRKFWTPTLKLKINPWIVLCWDRFTHVDHLGLTAFSIFLHWVWVDLTEFEKFILVVLLLVWSMCLFLRPNIFTWTYFTHWRIQTSTRVCKRSMCPPPPPPHIHIGCYIV